MSAELNDDLKLIQEELKNDPLLNVIKGTSLEEQLFSEEYLNNLELKRWYSTPEVADWFGINDGQLRYYIKPFHDYLFTNDTPSSSTAIRVNMKTILKLRMIFLLKDEYRVKGLQRLIGLGEGYVSKKPNNSDSDVPTVRGDLEQRVDALTRMMEQVIKTGLFEVSQGEEGPRISVKQLPEEKDSALTKTLSEENSMLRETLEETRKNQRDIALDIKERRIEMKIRSDLRLEALKKWTEQNKHSFIRKLLRSEQIDLEKENFIQSYVNQHINEHLKSESED
jgi:hypothetical protein